MIASIPLVRAGLPPLSIPASSKKAYFEGLHKVNPRSLPRASRLDHSTQARDNNYEPLVRCFVQALEASATTLEGLKDRATI